MGDMFIYNWSFLTKSQIFIPIISHSFTLIISWIFTLIISQTMYALSMLSTIKLILEWHIVISELFKCSDKKQLNSIINELKEILKKLNIYILYQHNIAYWFLRRQGFHLTLFWNKELPKTILMSLDVSCIRNQIILVKLN